MTKLVRAVIAINFEVDDEDSGCRRADEILTTTKKNFPDIEAKIMDLEVVPKGEPAA